MTAVRTAAVAGQFYPGDARTLSSQVGKFLAEAAAPAGPTPKAIIAPHAGYVYSGAIAASAYAKLAPAAEIIKRVILLGPCHRVAVRGLALSGADFFETPLGRVPVDKDAEAAILDMPQVVVFDPTHRMEHSLEVHIPFLQTVLGDFKLVPIVVGEANPDAVAQVLERLWGGPETLIVVSSDLSHYLDYDSARAIDGRTCKAIESLDPAAIEQHGACGRFPVGGLLRLAKAKGMRVETLDLRNSGDTAGSKDRVVGYGSWAFYEQPAARRPVPLNIRLKAGPSLTQSAPDGSAFEAATRKLLADHGSHLLKLAGNSIAYGLGSGRPLSIDLDREPEPLRAQGACFVTLKTRERQLRGCIGSPVAHRPLALDVVDNAFKAAYRDPRFRPVVAEELSELQLSISVLSPQSPMTFADEADLLRQLRPEIDGLVIADGGRRALFLPSVWEQLPDPRQFLAHLKRKAGMALDHWSPNFQANRFIAEEAYADDLDDPAAIWTIG